MGVISVKLTNGKLLKCVVSRTSNHIDFSNEAIQILNTFQFVICGGKRIRRMTHRALLTHCEYFVQKVYRKIWIYQIFHALKWMNLSI
ncbi:hypothetical protein PR048_015980 [Dryococelus australis]|uniref:Uncharacterized protein n=1 Tax=Dryococelus australis TaxID=614101 RepID=A0ABQ9HJL1_9NEOP|nr:hypothetical protein PR048_015980 [Dryococelus australis]